MTVPVTSVVLGIDPQKTRLGLALVTFEPPHRALWADTVSIDEEHGGWRHQQVMAALGVAEGRLWLVPRFRNREITRVGIEQVPYVGNPERFRELCEVVGIVQTKAHERWPWAVQVPLSPPAWKKTALGDGRASKADVRLWAYPLLGHDASTDVEQMQDAYDALGIAVAAAMVEIEAAA